jgi:hypothetical protein
MPEMWESHVLHRQAKGGTKQMNKQTSPSRDFQQAFSSHISGCLMSCDNCGHTYFDVANAWDWDAGELEALNELAGKKPDEYTACDGSISSYIVNGKEIPEDCQCGFGADQEQFIQKHAAQIADYLNKRGERLRKIADETKVAL